MFPKANDQLSYNDNSVSHRSINQQRNSPDPTEKQESTRKSEGKDYKMDFCFSDSLSSSRSLQSTFKSSQLDAYFDTDSIANIQHLLSDLLPYFRVKSVVTVILMIEMFVIVFIPNCSKTIKPFYRIGVDSSLWFAWFIQPFVTDGLFSTLFHFVFMVTMGAELQHKLCNKIKKSSRNKQNYYSRMADWNFFVCYYLINVGGVLLAVLAFLKLDAPIRTNIGSYSLYVFLQFLDYQETKGVSNNIEDDKNEQQLLQTQNSNEVVRVYKCLLLSYLVFMSQFKDQHQHFECFLGSLVLVFLFFYRTCKC